MYQMLPARSVTPAVRSPYDWSVGAVKDVAPAVSAPIISSVDVVEEDANRGLRGPPGCVGVAHFNNGIADSHDCLLYRAIARNDFDTSSAANAFRMKAIRLDALSGFKYMVTLPVPSGRGSLLGSRRVAIHQMFPD